MSEKIICNRYDVFLNEIENHITKNLVFTVYFLIACFSIFLNIMLLDAQEMSAFLYYLVILTFKMALHFLGLR